MRTTALVTVLGVILWAAPASAQLYKWTDERGVTHYSEKPPADKKGAPVTLRDATGGAGAPAAKSGRSASNSQGSLEEQEREFQRRQRERDERNAADERRLQEQAQRQSSSACESARRDLLVVERASNYYSFEALARARDRAARECR
jgi:hypothetical protein